MIVNSIDPLKKYIPHILIGLIIISVALLFLTGSNDRPRKLNERLSFRKNDKIPYGTFVAFQALQQLFPATEIFAEKREPGYWDSLSNYESDQALLIVSPVFNADETELNKLVHFVEEGNDVFISTMRTTEDVEKMLHLSIKYSDVYDRPYDISSYPDTMTISLNVPALGVEQIYSYPGKSLDFSLQQWDETTTTPLGFDKRNRPNLVHLRAGKGNLYFHLAPMAFTNYFLLYGNNIRYYEQMLSLISKRTRKLVWDEYYLAKPAGDDPNNKKPNWLSVLMNMENDSGKKPFKTAIWLAIGLLIAYVLLEMRRKQRVIPVIRKPKNDSLDFVKTIGRLYHDKGDHENLARKMAAYFLEHVRSRYKLQTSKLDEEFLVNLRHKTGVDDGELRPIIAFIQSLDHSRNVSDRELAQFHKHLESFYKKA